MSKDRPWRHQLHLILMTKRSLKNGNGHFEGYAFAKETRQDTGHILRKLLFKNCTCVCEARAAFLVSLEVDIEDKDGFRMSYARSTAPASLPAAGLTKLLAGLHEWLPATKRGALILEWE